jgi:hypothetical protein
MTQMANADEPLLVHSAGQEWLSSWHPPDLPAPDGKRHGSEGVCITANGEVILVTENGQAWDLPAGRPEEDEDWRATLEREVLEEACATVIDATLLGYGRGECINGPELGLVLVRSVWRATVTVHAWQPQYEITQRVVVSPREALAKIGLDHPFRPFRLRAFHDAGLI